MFWNNEKKQNVLAIILGTDNMKEKIPQDENGTIKDLKDSERICEGIIKSIHSNDPMSLKKYLKSFIDSNDDEMPSDEGNKLEGSIDWVSEMKKDR